jgi:hypothetical protein
MSAPRIVRLRLDLLIVDHDVQRPLDQKRAWRIAKEFRPESLGVLAVNLRPDGKYHVIDGQHRVHALRMLGLETDEVQVELYEGLTRAEEAEQFRLRNNTKAVVPIEKFKVRVVEGDPVAVRIAGALADYGWHIRAGATNASFAAVTAIEKVYRGPNGKGQNIDTVRAVLEIVTKAWSYEPYGVKDSIILALGAVLLRHGDKVDTGKLTDALAGYGGGPRKLLGDARGFQAGVGGTIRDALAHKLINLAIGK